MSEYEVAECVVHNEFKSVARVRREIGKSKTFLSIDYGLGEITVLIKDLRKATPKEIEQGFRDE